jgi:gliding motility-associated-like protein
MIRIGLTFILTLFSITFSFSQQLIINEVSQGTNSGEYVEFVVIGNQICTLPVPSIDLRKVIIDDNNGYFAPGSGTGIAAGAVRFADNIFWSAIPQGTYIVIYNEADRNSAIPPDDISLTDGNCRLIIPASSTLLEVTNVNSPSTLTNLYPPNTNWVAGASWAPLAMSNSNDSFQIPNLQVNGTPLHAVSWGNNTNGSIVYFNGSSANKVYSFTNTISNDWNIQSNWQAGNVGVNETPGMANNPENDLWIGSMNPQCGVTPQLTLNAITQNETCSGLCNGEASVSVINGVSNYSYLWSNGSTQSSITNLCEGNYSLTVTSNDICPIISTISVTIQSGIVLNQVIINTVSDLAVTDNPVQLISNQNSGTWTSNCNTCLSSNGVFDPSISDEGSFEVCYELGSGQCSSVSCITINVLNPCSPQSTNGSNQICPGDSVLIFNNWETEIGNYSNSYLGLNGCDSVHTIQLTFFEVNDIVEYKSICNEDSINFNGEWIYEPGVYSTLIQNVNGCNYKNSLNLIEENCVNEPFLVFIPNAFNPDGGKINNEFKIVITGGKLLDGFIINRWGEIIYSFSEEQQSWNGTNSKGEISPDGIYTYVVNCISDSLEEKKYTGFVTLIK